MHFRKIIIVCSFLTLFACSSNNQKISENINENNNLEVEMIKAYNEGDKALNSGDA